MSIDPTRRAMRAKEILQDPMVAEAFSTLEAHYHDSWAASHDAGAREEHWHQLQSLRAFKGHFEAVLVDAQVFKANNPTEE